MRLNAYIVKGVVSSHLDRKGKKIPREKDGTFFVDLEGYQDPVSVTYTTPFYSIGNGGMLAIPDPGASVLIIVSDDGNFYYLSTIVDFPSNDVTKGNETKEVVRDSKRAYPDETALCRRVTLTNQFDSGLKIQRIFSPAKIINNVFLKTENGKQVLLDDSPNGDAISILTEHKDGITIQAAPSENGLNSERSIDISAKGSVYSRSFNGSQNIFVNNGGDINIINNTHHIVNPNTITPGYRAGNVNVVSQWNDINISVRGPDSNIFITTPLARIKIDTTGGVSVQATNAINLKSAVAINLDAPTININSDAQTNIYTGGTATLTGATVGIEGPGGVFLNSGRGGSPAPIAPDVTRTDYLD